MSVLPQVEVGGLALNGLRAFSPLLAAMTSDNVAPTAMIQLEELGQCFHINGKFSQRLPDLLQRCSSTRLDQLGLIVGWRRGDAASLMSKTAGGQSIALLCFCLTSVNTSPAEVGAILYDLSERILPINSAISSINQLAAAADRLSSKLMAIGFGNILAEQAVKIHDVHQSVGKSTRSSIPSTIFDPLTRESTVELFQALSKVFYEEDCVLHISGVLGIGNILTIVLIMFPENVRVVIDGSIVQEGPRPLINIAVDLSMLHATTISVESKLPGPFSQPTSLLIKPNVDKGTYLRYTFSWDGHLADALRITFGDVGAPFNTEICIALCDLLVLTAPYVKGSDYKLTRDDTSLPLSGCVALLGSEPQQRMYRTCKEIFRTVPSGKPKDVRQALRDLGREFKSLVGAKSRCHCGKCDLAKGWTKATNHHPSKLEKSCICRTLWRAVGRALLHAFECLFVRAHPNAVLTLRGLSSLNYEDQFHALDAVHFAAGIHDSEYSLIGCTRLYQHCMSFVGPEINSLAQSNGASTMTPAVLSSLQMWGEDGIEFHLHDGLLIFKNQYYKFMKAIPCRGRQRATRSSYNRYNLVVPDSIGAHDGLSLTIRELSDSLELRTTVVVGRQSIQIDLHSTVIASMGVVELPPCDHDAYDELDPHLSEVVFTTTVAAPIAMKPNTSLVQTKDSPTGQLLACTKGIRAMIMRGCCVSCAVREARDRKHEQIIVAT